MGRSKKSRQIIEADMAWDSNSRPEMIEFLYVVPNNIAEAILAVVTKDLPATRNCRLSLMSLKPATDPAGHFYLKSSKDEWFLRATRRQRKNQDMEDIIAFYLSNNGIKVNLPILTNLNIVWKGYTYLLYIFPFIKGRHYNGSDSDLIAISSTVVNMHSLLKSFKFSKLIYANALKTANRLLRAKRAISRSLEKNDFSIFEERREWAERNSDWLRTMSDDFNPFLCKLPESQCLHGELHLGNVIFSAENGEVLLTDFEEVWDAWFPPSFDLAYLVHRFCMDGVPSRESFHQKLSIVERGYGSLPPALKAMMSQVCWYNIALLIDRSLRRESISPEEEYNKFVRFEKLSKSLF